MINPYKYTCTHLTLMNTSSKEPVDYKINKITKISQN